VPVLDHGMQVEGDVGAVVVIEAAYSELTVDSS
jgi:hypothetical protein